MTDPTKDFDSALRVNMNHFRAKLRKYIDSSRISVITEKGGKEIAVMIPLERWQQYIEEFEK